MKTLVKICGIRSVESAQAVIGAGADFLGFNFVPSSKRYIDPVLAKEIIRAIKGKIKTVGVFQNTDTEYVNSLSMDLPLDFVQLHGNEDEFFIKKIKTPVIKVIHNIRETPAGDSVAFLLFDRAAQGTGKMVHVGEAKIVARKHNLFLAGGLNVDNVQNLIKKIRPYAVDVASGIETEGMPDIKKIIHFIQKSKGALI